MVSEVGEAVGATAGFVSGLALTHHVTPGGGKVGDILRTTAAFALAKVTEGVSRQYTFAKYNEGSLK
jgi:hypothetical protein